MAARGKDEDREIVLVELAAPCGVERISVEGEAYGPWWAITPSWGEDLELDPRYVALTHVPSGRAVGRFSFQRRDLVQELALEFQLELDREAWAVADHNSIPA